MENDLLQGFLAQAESSLPTIRSGILISSQTGNVYGELNTSLRQTTAVKDAAAIVGVEDAAQIAEELEEKLRVFAALKTALTAEQSRALLDKITELDAILARIRFDTEDFSVHIEDFIDQSFENLGFSEPSFSIAEPPAETIVETGAEADEWEEEFEIDEEMLEIFGEEAEELIQSIGSNLKILEKTPNDREALLEIRRNAHTLKGSAGIVGLKVLSQVAHRVEDLLDYVADHEIEAGEKIFEILLAAADCFSALATGENSAQPTKKIDRFYEDFAVAMTALQAKKTAVEKIEPTTETPAQVSDATVSAAGHLTSPANDPVVSAVAESPLLNRSVVRVSLEKLNDLVKITSGLVVSRSVFEQRLAELERQIGELHNSTRRLQHSTNKIETDFEADMLNMAGRPASFVMRPSPVWETSQISPRHGEGQRTKDEEQKAFDSLELDRYTEFHQTMRDLIETTGDTSAINAELDNLKGNLESLFENQRNLIEEMQEKLLRLRMVSFGSLNVRLQRTVRMTAEEQDKSAALVINGENLEVDTQILDSLTEPLLHLLRNAVAHGIESPETRRLLGKPEVGKITVGIADEGTHFILTVSDDGRGISAATLKAKAVQQGLIGKAEAEAMSEQEAFALVFHVGLTTAEKISQVSGRGVGMNIVKTAVARQQGTISIASETHRGTTFTVRLPVQTAVTRALLVKSGERFFAFPIKLVRHISRMSEVGNLWASGESLASDSLPDDVPLSPGERTAKDPDEKTKVPESSIFHLNDLLDLPPGAARKEANSSLILLKTPDAPCGLIVDEIVKAEEIIIKPLGNPLQNLPGLLGATILGDGSVVPVLDLIYLLRRQDANAEVEIESPAVEPETMGGAEPIAETTNNLTVLIVDDSPSVRHLTSNIVKNAGWTAIVAKDGLEALDVLQKSRELPGVILSDVEMPRMNGYELLAALKKLENLQTIPVVMITSRANQKHRQKAFDLGVSEYLTKPFDDAQLIKAITSLSASPVQRT